MTPEQGRRRFLALHVPGAPLLMPNAWDAGSARLLEAAGFAAIASTSSGFAATLGRRDYGVARPDVVGHAAALVAAVDVPVSVDAEDGFARDADGVARTVVMLAEVGAAGCSIEDSDPRAEDPIRETGAAAERVAAAAQAARAGGLVLTARSENLLHGRGLADTIARLQAYQEAGADVLFAPGLSSAADIRSVVANVDRPVNVLVVPGCPPVAQLAELGVARVSVGGGFAFAGFAAVLDAAAELREAGTYGWLARVVEARPTIAAALAEESPPPPATAPGTAT